MSADQLRFANIFGYAESVDVDFVGIIALSQSGETLWSLSVPSTDNGSLTGTSLSLIY
jgi:hypothetical protein